MPVISELIIHGENKTNHENAPITKIVVDKRTSNEFGIPEGSYHFAKPSESIGNVCENAVEEPIIDMLMKGNNHIVGNSFYKTNFSKVADFPHTASNGFYKYAYITGLKPNTVYNVVIQRKEGTNITTAKTVVLLSGDIFSASGDSFTVISHYISTSEGRTTYTTGANGRLTFGIYAIGAYATTDEKLAMLWENTDILLTESGVDLTPNPDNQIEIISVGDYDEETGKYKIPITINGAIITNIYLNEPLRKLWNYIDYIDYKNKKVIRNVKALRLTSDIGWTSATSGGVPYNYCALSDIRKGVEDKTFWCNTYQIEAKNSHHIDKRICYRLNFNGFLIADDNYRNPVTFGEMLDSGNVVVMYPIDTTEETIEIEEISTFDETSIVETETTTKPSEIKINYWKQISGDE